MKKEALGVLPLEFPKGLVKEFIEVKLLMKFKHFYF